MARPAIAHLTLRQMHHNSMRVQSPLYWMDDGGECDDPIKRTHQTKECQTSQKNIGKELSKSAVIACAIKRL